jgi:hypothetical protein
VGRDPRVKAAPLMWGGGSYFMRNMLILNETRKQDKPYVSLGSLFG